MTDWWTRERILNVAGLLILVVVLLPFVIYAVPGVIGADASHVVLSGSMSPAIKAGDVVIVRDVPAQTIEEGDVITFETPTGGLPTTHRVTEVQGQGADLTFQTKGDANEDADPERITPTEVNGKVIFTIPLIGHVILFATTPLGLIVFLGLPFGLLILSEAWVFAKEARGDSGGAGSKGGDGGGSRSKFALVPGLGAAEDENGQGGTEPYLKERSEATAAAAEHRGENREGDTESDSFEITRNDLQISLVVTGMFFAYAGWMFYQQWFVSDRQTAIPVAVLVGTTATLLILTGLYYGSGEPSDTVAPEQGGSGTAVTPNGGHAQSRMLAAGRGTGPQSAASEDSYSSPTAGLDREKPAAVHSMGDLVRVATETRTPIEWRPWEDVFELAPPAEVYVLEDVPGPATGVSGGTKAGAENGDGPEDATVQGGPAGSDGTGAADPSDGEDVSASHEPAADESGGEKAND